MIANRGEIAVRVITACHELGIEAVAVYSEADRNALHVQLADFAVCIGPAPVGASYLNQSAILEAAHSAGADAVHPGYGFLSENPVFAEACEEAGLTFVGPPSTAIRAMASKSAAKRAMEAAGVPVVPGYHGESQDPDVMVREADRIGYPVLIKAAAGGGGRGMRVVETPDLLVDHLAGAAREAANAFGDGRLLLERYLARPRHIEVQVIADHHGNVVHLGERECSIQRRHQKVVEEAPAPDLAPETRSALGEAAVRVARSIDYRNAGTVEFLLDEDGHFYFLEMNTRVQVEHGVTELVTGIDIVQTQLVIASGAELPWSQADIQLRGSAIQCRVYAEDPYRSFLPSTGVLSVFAPPSGPGIRNDVGVYQGDEVTPYYDPMLAKLLVLADERGTALDRIRAALSRYGIVGVTTNIPLLAAIIDDPAFRAGRVDVHHLERDILEGFQPPVDLPYAVLAAAALQGIVVGDQPRVSGGGPWQQLRGWRTAGAETVETFQWQGAPYRVSVARAGDGWRVTGTELAAVLKVRMPQAGVMVLDEDGQIARVFFVARGNAVHVHYLGEAYVLERAGVLSPDRARGAAVTADGSKALRSPLPGVVMQVSVREGDLVSARQTLVVIEAMKMEHSLHAPVAGVVKKVACMVDDRVNEGELLIEIDSAT